MSTQTDSLFAVQPVRTNRQQQIMDALWMSSGKSRAQMATETGMRLSSVCGRCNELLHLDLIYVCGEAWDTETQRMVETLALK